MDELKLTGNHLKGSRPVLSFDAAFDAEPHLQLIREMLTQVGAGVLCCVVLGGRRLCVVRCVLLLCCVCGCVCVSCVFAPSFADRAGRQPFPLQR